MDTKNGAALLPMAKARGLRAVQVVKIGWHGKIF